MSKKKDISAVLLGVVVGVILWITLLGRDTQTEVVFLKPFHSFQAFWRDIQYGRITGNLFGNILIFIPVGLLLPGAWDLKGWTLLAGASLSLLIETGQLITSCGCFDLDDVMLNTIGTAIGLGIYSAVKRIANRQLKD